MSHDLAHHLREAARQLTTNPSQTVAHANKAIAAGATRGYFYRGLARVELKDYASGLKDLSTAINLMGADATTDDTEFARVLFHTALAKKYFVGCEEALPDLDRARAALGRAASSGARGTRSEEVTTWLDRVLGLECDLLLHLGRYDEAATSATALIDEGLASGFLLRATALSAQDEYVSALADLASHFEWFTETADAQRLRANVLLQMSKWEEAVEAAQAAVKLDSSSIPSRRILCLAYVQLQRYPEAAKEARQALAQDNSLAWPHVVFGLDFFHDGVLADAMREWDEASLLDPSGIDGADARGFLDDVGKNVDKALLATTPAVDGPALVTAASGAEELVLMPKTHELFYFASRLDVLSDSLGEGAVFIGLGMLFARTPRLVTPCRSETTFAPFINALNDLLQKIPEGRLEKLLRDQKSKDFVASISAFRNVLEHVPSTSPEWAKLKPDEWEAKKKRWNELARDLCRDLIGTPVPDSSEHWATAQVRLLERSVDLLRDTYRRLADSVS